MRKFETINNKQDIEHYFRLPSSFSHGNMQQPFYDMLYRGPCIQWQWVFVYFLFLKL